MYFTIGGQIAWNPSMGIGRLYVKYLAAVEEILQVPVGAWPVPGDPDDIRIDPESFGRFTANAQRAYGSSNSPVFREQLGVVLFPAMVMLQRAGFGDLVSEDDPEQRERAAAFSAGMTL